MSSGRFRHKLAFDVRAMVDDGFGNEQAGDWAEQFQVAADITPLKGGETVTAARLAGQQPVIITVRISTQSREIEAGWRARDVRTGEVYALTSPPTDIEKKRRTFDILATTGVAA